MKLDKIKMLDCLAGRGLNLGAAARLCNVDQRTFTAAFSGRKISVGTVTKILRGLNIDAANILKEGD